MERAAGMALEPAGRAVRRRLSPQGLSDNLRFSRPKGQQFNLTAVHDGAHAHGERALRHEA